MITFMPLLNKKKCQENTNKWLDENPKEKDSMDPKITADTNDFYIVLDNNKSIGWIAIGSPALYGNLMKVLFMVYIDPGSRGKGLLQKIIERSKTLGVNFVQIGFVAKENVSKYEKLYASAGFTEFCKVYTPLGVAGEFYGLPTAEYDLPIESAYMHGILLTMEDIREVEKIKSLDNLSGETLIGYNDLIDIKIRKVREAHTV